MKRYYDVYVIIPFIKYYHYALINVNILFPLFQGLGTIPKYKTGRFGGQPERSVFRCGASPDLLATLQVNPGQPTPFFASVSTLAVLALPPTIALTRTFVLVIIGMRD